MTLCTTYTRWIHYSICPKMQSGTKRLNMMTRGVMTQGKAKKA
jgi:hypothetical protein